MKRLELSEEVTVACFTQLRCAGGGDDCLERRGVGERQPLSTEDWQEEPAKPRDRNLQVLSSATKTMYTFIYTYIVMFHPITTRKWVLLVRDLAAGPMAFTQKTATCARVVCWCSSPGASGAEDASRRRVCSVDTHTHDLPAPSDRGHLVEHVL